MNDTASAVDMKDESNAKVDPNFMVEDDVPFVNPEHPEDYKAVDGPPAAVRCGPTESGRC